MTKKLQPVKRVGFIGIGAIGEPMAVRILQAGFELHVWNRTPAKAASLIAAGALSADSPSELAARTDVLCLCVTDDQAAETVVFGPGGAARAAHQGLVVVDLSTIHPLATQRLSNQASQLGFGWVDSPVSGGIAGARNGTLTAFTGGREEDVERVRPVIRSFTARMTHMGPAGSGQIAKICNQMVSFSTATALAEALHLAKRLNLEVSRLPKAMEGGLADSAVLRQLAPGMLEGRFSGNTLTILKDLEIAIDLGRHSVTPTPLAASVNAIVRMLVARGNTNIGLGGVLRFFTEQPLASSDVNTIDSHKNAV